MNLKLATPHLGEDMLNERSRRIADLFVEGTELYLGQDDNDTPVLIWVNKLNSFEVEEARRDGVVNRGLRTASLSKTDSDEVISINALIDTWSDQALAEARVEQQANQIDLDVFNDVEVNHKDLLERVRRGPELLADAGAADDDPRRAQLLEDQNAWLEAIRKTRDKKRHHALQDALELERKDLVKDYLKDWRERASMEAFIEERRVTELYIAMRDCKGTEVGRDDEHQLLWDHTDCDHSRRLLSHRSEVRAQSDQLIERVVATLETITVAARDSGNSGAPTSSSESLEQHSAEAVSTPSIPEETSLVAPGI